MLITKLSDGKLEPFVTVDRKGGEAKQGVDSSLNLESDFVVVDKNDFAFSSEKNSCSRFSEDESIINAKDDNVPPIESIEAPQEPGKVHEKETETPLHEEETNSTNLKGAENESCKVESAQVENTESPEDLTPR